MQGGLKKYTYMTVDFLGFCILISMYIIFTHKSKYICIYNLMYIDNETLCLIMINQK